MIHQLPPEQCAPVTHLEKTRMWRKTGMFTQHRFCGGITWDYVQRTLSTMQQKGSLSEAEKEFMHALEQTLIDRFLQQ